ncbi:hypothetical protein EDF81_1626 [Enterobacter sp. BIGb0383]|uniref:hypothetical protein n=1 Tax=unclassified Enterobacter TaxID=2608935 RepID=UPI000F499945|nr:MULTISPECIES: hypothetical protein [unclassified Enterobacter]ROP63104.1 hypothetical protein EDF81_1626 [Enterobacter sp. BIGb0383]ROS13265.1 hypothetical protein EC848_1628 [Enterobacter sp. BIGb0359]
MKFDVSLHKDFLLVAMLPLLFIAVRLYDISLFDGLQVQYIETFQAVWLLFCSVFTLVYMRPSLLSRPQLLFWVWAALWWFLLFGRSISWGRDYFPDEPRWIFRLLSILWISPVFIMLFFRDLRDEIKSKLSGVAFPITYFSLALVCFLISDTIEHKRVMAIFFLNDPAYQDLVEELYEVPFMFALLLTALYFMKIDRQRSAEPCITHGGGLPIPPNTSAKNAG